MSIAKEKMVSKRFIPILSDIPEEELYHTVDLGWDIPCARRGRRFSAISLKRENSRRAVHCGGCPGCDNDSNREQKITALTRSNSCKTCISDDYKQKIVRKWLDEVPPPTRGTRLVKSVAKVTPRVTDVRKKADILVIPTEPPRVEETSENRTVKPKAIIINEKVHTLKDKESSTVVEFRNNKNDKHINAVTKKTDVAKVQPLNISKQKPKPKSPEQKARQLRKKLPPPPPPPTCAPAILTSEEEEIPAEVKKNMEAVIKELSKCKKVEPTLLEEVKTETIDAIIPKIVIPVVAADSHYYSDDNMLMDPRKRDIYKQRDIYDMDSLDRGMLKKRRFSLASGPELIKQGIIRDIDSERSIPIQIARERMSRSWRDVRKAVESCDIQEGFTNSNNFEVHSLPVSEIFVNNASEPLYNNMPKPGPLTIQVRGSPVENRRKFNDDFDQDTLDRKPKKESKHRVDKILFKSAGSFKVKSVTSDTNDETSGSESVFTRKIGSLRQIYEAKAKAHEEEVIRAQYLRRGSASAYDSDDLAAFVRSIRAPDLVRQIEKDPKPPIPPKQRRSSDIMSPKFLNISRESPPGERRMRSPEEKDKFPAYLRSENMISRRSGRRSNRTRSRRTDLRKLYRTEDSGYLSTDSNDSKRRARYLLQLHNKASIPKVKHVIAAPVVISRPLTSQIESDTDDLESLCDGRSESGGESVETDSVFFGNFNDTKQLFAELGLGVFEPKSLQGMEQIDSGFAGETNIVLSGDSDSEHRSVISIVADCDGRASSASVQRIDESPYMKSIEC